MKGFCRDEGRVEGFNGDDEVFGFSSGVVVIIFRFEGVRGVMFLEFGEGWSFWRGVIC